MTLSTKRYKDNNTVLCMFLLAGAEQRLYMVLLLHGNSEHVAPLKGK